MADASANADQAAYWSSASGLGWVEYADALDATFAPMLDLLLDEAAPRSGERVLDIGCGTGASALAAARHVAPGPVTGVDIAPPLLALARQRAGAAGLGNLRFLEADAQTATLPEASDLALSRLGTMFFADPQAAFANILRGLAPGGRLVFVAWAPAAENLWFAVPAAAAVRRLGRPPAADPHAPGPLAFADAPRVVRLLEAAGFEDARAATREIRLTPPGDAAAAAALAARVGPAVRILRLLGGSAADMAAIEAETADGLAPFAGDDGIAVPARLHLFSARRRGRGPV